MLQFSHAFVRSLNFVLIAALACPWQVARAGPEEELRAQFEALPAEQRQGMTFESAREEVRQIAVLIQRMESLRRPAEPATTGGAVALYRLPSDPQHYPVTISALRTAVFERFTRWLGDHPEYRRVDASRNNVQGFWRSAAFGSGLLGSAGAFGAIFAIAKHHIDSAGLLALISMMTLVFGAATGAAGGGIYSAREAIQARRNGVRFFRENPMGQWIARALAREGVSPLEVTVAVSPTSGHESLLMALSGARRAVASPLGLIVLPFFFASEAWRKRADRRMQDSAPADSVDQPVANPALAAPAVPAALLIPVRIAPREPQGDESPEVLFDRAVRAFLEHYQQSANSDEAMQVAQRICPVFTIEHAQEALNADPSDAVGSARHGR